jgi:hypothetical protein
MAGNPRIDSGWISPALSSNIHHIDSPFSARVIVGERDSDPSDPAMVAESQEKLPQMEAVAADANIPGDCSSLAPNSGGIRSRRPKESIVVEENFATALKIGKKDHYPKNPFFEAESPPFESSSNSGRKQTRERSDQTQKRLGSDGEKQSPIEGPRPKQK